MDNRPDVRARELVDEFFEKQDEPQYMRNVLSGLSGIMLVRALLHKSPPSFPALSSSEAVTAEHSNMWLSWHELHHAFRLLSPVDTVEHVLELGVSKQIPFSEQNVYIRP